VTRTVPVPPGPPLTGGAPPTVSVAMITYNHERFIAQAIESVLMQRTTFLYELVIGEDHSLDKTREIVKDFQRRYPSKIRVLLADQNLGAMTNCIRTLQASEGQYIALLDGDDYWTDPRKLQLQVDFLNDHPDCAICFHNAAKVYEDGRSVPGLYCPAGQKPFFTLADLLAGNFIPTCSVMVRNGLLRALPAWFQQLGFGDWAFYVLNAQYGNIGYLDEVMGTYRVHGHGQWSGESKIQRLSSQISVYKAFRAHLDSRYTGAIRAALARSYLKLSSQYERRGDLRSARSCARKAVATGAFQRGVDHRDALSTTLRLHAPVLRRLVGSARRLL
jgi:glycosyltransferase involved in cell wall biosynthesis